MTRPVLSEKAKDLEKEVAEYAKRYNNLIKSAMQSGIVAFVVKSKHIKKSKAEYALEVLNKIKDNSSVDTEIARLQIEIENLSK